MRLDLFLKQSRLIPRRTVAQEVCDAGAVSVGVLKFDTSDSTLIDMNDAAKGLLTGELSVTQPDGTSTVTASYYLLNIGAGSAPTIDSPYA